MGRGWETENHWTRRHGVGARELGGAGAWGRGGGQAQNTEQGTEGAGEKDIELITAK